MPKITIIDGNSLLFRAYYATAYPGVEIMRSQDGTPTNAIFAFSNMLNKIVTGIKEGEALFVAFDAGKHNFRHDALETYKANRKPVPEDLIKQFPIVREFLKSFGVFQFEEEGFEGDDIAGTVAKTAEKEGYDVHLYTSDRDFLQLVTDKITVHIIKTGLSNVLDMTPSLVKETYGFEPLQIIDYKGLRGDASDNLPGIPGIGEKTAVKLIEEYGSFDNIIASVDGIKGKVGEAIKANKEMGRLSRDLAIIKTDIQLPFKVKNTEYQGYEFQSLNEFCQKYGLKQFINNVSAKWKKQDLTLEEIDVSTVESLKDIGEVEEIGIALDFENEDYTNATIYGVAFEVNKKHIYINIENLQKDEYAKAILKDETIKKYCFDFKGIKVGLSRYNIDIKGIYFDLLIAAYLIDSSTSSNVDTIMNIFGVDLGNDEPISLFSQENPQRTAKVAYFSTKLAQKVFDELDKISARELYNTLEIPLINTLADMEIEGFPMDVKTIDKFGDEFRKKADELANEIYAMAGERFNLASPKQMGEILYNKMGLTGNRKMSTSFEALKDIEKEHPIVNKILEYRKYFKLITTYVEGLKAHVHEDGKIHAKFNQAQTQTGRLSSSEPNLQNISVRDEEGKLIRKAFFYPNNEYEILSLDYSQIELRVLASLSKCKGLIDVFRSGEDIHSATAKTVFNLSGEPTTLQRRKAKTVNFGVVYGISDWGLADELSIPVYEAKEIISNFYRTYPEVADFFKNVVANALKDGYVSTLLGRRRYLRELHDSNYQTREFAKRAAMNAPIQGTAADLIKMAMIKVDKAIKESGLRSRMVLQIHDELIFKVVKEEKEQVYNLVKEIMENAMHLEIPFEVDGGFGLDWYDAK